METMMRAIVWAQQHGVAAVTVVFTVIIVTTFWPGSKTTLERHGHIPLDDEF